MKRLLSSHRSNSALSLVAVFRFGYERFELRARLGPGNLEHAIAEAAEVAASVFARWSHEAFGLRTAGSRWRGRRASASLGRASRNHCLRGVLPVGTWFPWKASFSSNRQLVALPWAAETRHQLNQFLLSARPTPQQVA